MNLLLILTHIFQIVSNKFCLRFVLTDVSSFDFALVVAVPVVVAFPYRDSVPGHKMIDFAVLCSI